MQNNGEFIYIMYPVRVEKLKKLGLPFLTAEDKVIPIEEEADFMPLWYGNAKFPEDET